MLLLKLGSGVVYDNVNSTVGLDRSRCTIWTNKTGTNCVHLFGGPECNYWIALMYYEI